MLVIRSAVHGPRDNQCGAVLVTVVVVMLVGFIVATAVASAVVFTVGVNARNKSDTQAFMAAESGRDAALASLNSAAGCSSTTFSGTAPDFTATIYPTSAEEQPTDASGLTAGCPTSDSTFVVIASAGAGGEGSTARIDAVYPWVPTYERRPGGVLAYFSEGFTATLSNYIGDLVVRTGDFYCNNGATITGDVWVLEGSASFGNTCTVRGNLYVRDHVTNNSHTITIEGDVIAGGDVSLSSSGASVGVDPLADGDPADDDGGTIHAGGDVLLSNVGNGTGTAWGDVLARGTAVAESNWNVRGLTTAGAPEPVFDPTLAWVHSVTGWVDLDNTAWGVAPQSNSCSINSIAAIKNLLEVAGPPVVVDLTNCSGSSQTLTLKNLTVRRDAVFITKRSARMIVSVEGTVGATSGRQVFFVHSDGSRNLVSGEPRPDCGNGSQSDRFSTSGAISSSLRIMVYSPCGLTGTVNTVFTGQLYTSDSAVHTVHAGYTCETMSWEPALRNLGCTIRGQGGVLTEVAVYRLGGLLAQTEQ